MVVALLGGSVTVGGCVGCSDHQLEFKVNVSNSCEDEVEVDIYAYDKDHNFADSGAVPFIVAPESEGGGTAGFDWSTTGQGEAPWFLEIDVYDVATHSFIGTDVPQPISDHQTVNVAIDPDKTVHFSVSGGGAAASLPQQVQTHVNTAVKSVRSRVSPKKSLP